MNSLIHALGGLGLFLLGMIIMTDALRALAGEKIRAALVRFTRNPASGAATGAISTAILQSSSATTVAAVGFVAAGLMTFSESLGIIFGANIGTTITGWLVALIGFKLQLGSLMLPLIFIGVLLRLFGKKHIAQSGLALAGFGLIFVGISMLQLGMSELQSVVTPENFPTDTLAGRLKLVAIGIIITIITQSSSAGVAAALAAVFTGAINFEQAAALVIGMDVGTTVTAAMATIGGSVSAKRTGFSHVIYNFITALGALVILTPYTLIWESIAPGELFNNAEIALVGFHTTFNALGVIIILPFTHVFARFIQKLIPDKADAYTESLDTHLLQEPDLALTAVEASIHRELLALLKHLASMLNKERANWKTSLLDLQVALNETHNYIDQIHLDKNQSPYWDVLIAEIHSLDHMQRLHERCEEDEDRAMAALQTPELQHYIGILNANLEDLITHVEIKNWLESSKPVEAFSRQISVEANTIRQKIMSQVAEGKLNVPAGTDSLEAIRWLRRVSAHLIRIIKYQLQTQDLLSNSRHEANIIK